MKVIVTGDSWATGEFGPNATPLSYDKDKRFSRTVHPTLSMAFADAGVETLVVGQPGRSNLQTIEHTRQMLEANHGIGAVFVFQTDPVRDAWPHVETVLDTSITQFSLDHLRTFYARIVENATGYGVPYYLLGGCSDVDMDLAREAGVTVLVPSITQLVTPDFMPSIHYGSWFVEMLAEAHRNAGRLAEWFPYHDTYLYKREWWHREPFFTDEHPSRTTLVAAAQRMLEII